MAETQDYSSGDWHVRAGSEDAFIARWTEFLEWTRDSAPGFVSARLVRDVSEPGHFVSLGEWKDAPAAAAWMTLPDFAAKYGACAALCEEARGGRYTLAAEVSR
jgi:heme-degrading monooxygenase HmoA